MVKSGSAKRYDSWRAEREPVRRRARNGLAIGAAAIAIVIGSDWWRAKRR